MPSVNKNPLEKINWISIVWGPRKILKTVKEIPKVTIKKRHEIAILKMLNLKRAKNLLLNESQSGEYPNRFFISLME